MVMEPQRAQAEFEREIIALARDLPRMAPKEACARLAWLKRQAVLEGFAPTAVLADGLADAIQRDGRNVPFNTWFDALTLAAGCGPENSEAGPLLLATVGVRFAG
jgi:hypothetical protein